MVHVPTNGQKLNGPPHRLVWDAWNRLRKVYDDDNNLIAEYQYDALMRRITSTVDSSVRHFYYDDQWRSVEERTGSKTTAERQYVWQPGNRWEMILRDRSTADNGTLHERLYSLKDELDPVALADVAGGVVERYAYSAFGKVSIFDGSYTSRSTSSYEWNYLFHGEFVDAETGWMNYGFRYYSIDLGRWLSEDPAEGMDDFSLYRFIGNDPLNAVDYIGLFGWRDALGYVPVVGSALDSYDAFKSGNTGMGLVHLGLAITDATGVGGLAKGVIVGGFKWAAREGVKKSYKKGLKETWEPLRKRLGKNGVVDKGQHVHHGLIDQNSKLGKTLPPMLKNHPMNLNPLRPRNDITMDAWHKMIEGKLPGLNPLERLWYGTPDYVRPLPFSLASYITGQLINEPTKDNGCP